MRKVLTPLLHLLAWGILFLVPFLVHETNHLSSTGLPWRDWTRLALVSAIFYFNYFVLIPRLVYHNRFPLFLLANFGIAILQYSIFFWAIDFRPPSDGLPPPPPSQTQQSTPWEPEHHPKPPHQHGPFSAFLFGSIFVVCMTSGMALAIRMTERYNQDMSRKQQMETEHLRSELSYLKLQLSPHFLFNTLNNIYSLVDLDQQQAQNSIHHLSKLLRYLLYETNADHVPIQGEVTFLQSYLQLMSLRLGPHVQLHTEFHISNPKAPIAPLLLLPLIENAFKHGIHAQEPSRISLRMVEAEGLLELNLENTDYPKETNDRTGSGLGLANLRKRLALLYADRHTYHTTQSAGIYSVQLSLQLRES